ncbi:MAG: hypothetical protein ACYSR5_11910 [Planctomycetota bacterium]
MGIWVRQAGPQDYDPNDPDIVNFLDYAKQADSWLNEFLWP